MFSFLISPVNVPKVAGERGKVHPGSGGIQPACFQLTSQAARVTVGVDLPAIDFVGPKIGPQVAQVRHRHFGFTLGRHQRRM
jgi:hypothetical protein